MLRGLAVGDPVGMLFCNHVGEVDQAASELSVRLREPQWQRPRVVTDIATLRAAIPEPQTRSVQTALLRGWHTSGRVLEVVSTPCAGAEVPNRGPAVILPPARVGSTV